MIFKRTLLFALFFCLSSITLAEKKLVGYLPSYRNLDLQKTELLTDLIFFSIEPRKNGEIKVEPALIKLLEKGKGIENCRKFICVGGWGKSENFKHVSLDPALRKKFITIVLKFVKDYKLDGVDYDWEHPKNKDEEKAYEELIKETAETGIKVSIAAAGWQKFSPAVFKHLFAVNIMSYDHPKEHSTLAMAEKDINNFVKMGCPPEKINLGVPFYGRHVENRKSMSYNKMIIPDQTTDIVDGYYFNNLDILNKKSKLIKKQKLAGIMIWEIEQDDAKLTLLKSIKRFLSEK